MSVLTVKQTAQAELESGREQVPAWSCFAVQHFILSRIGIFFGKVDLLQDAVAKVAIESKR
jgi:hypothetical protein